MPHFEGFCIAPTLDISQAITNGSFETRSREKTLLVTLFASIASPAIRHNKDD